MPTTPPNSDKIPQIFNRKLVSKHGDRAANAFSQHDFLLREMATRTCERLEYIKRSFPNVLVLGTRSGIAAEILYGKNNIANIIQCDISPEFAKHNKKLRVIADEEFLPFAENSFDLVISIGNLHTTNDLLGTIIQIRKVLKPEGLFLGTLYGGQTLKELRLSFEKAELDTRGGISPRVMPFIDIKDAGMLLQRAGFAMPVADCELLNIEYSHPLKLMHDLRGMGESNAMHGMEKHFTTCTTMMLAVDNYLRDFYNENERINASFELITLTGWKDAP